MPEQTQATGEETTEGLAEATAAVELDNVSREQSATRLSPAQLTTGKDSTLTRTSLGTAVAAEPAAVVAIVVAMEAAAASVSSPSKQDTDVEKAAAVGARGAAALTSSVPEDRCKPGHSPVYISPQPEPQRDPQPPTKSAPLRETNEGRTPNKARSSRFRTTVDDGTEEKGQDRTSTTSLNFALVEAAVVAGVETRSVTAAATDSVKKNMEEVQRERRAISEAIPTSSTRNVGDRMAAVAAEVVVNVKKGARKKPRGTFNIVTRGGRSLVAPRAASVRMALRSGQDVVPPVRLPANTADGPMIRDGAGTANFMAIEERCLSESHLRTAEKTAEPEMSMDEGAAKEVWVRVMQDNAHSGFDVNPAATRIDMASKGRPARRET